MLAQHAQEWKEEWIAEGVAKGMAKGIAKGKAEGKAEVLLRLLGRRFGPLAPGIEDRIRVAECDVLDDWADRVLDAHTVTEVFRLPVAAEQKT